MMFHESAPMALIDKAEADSGFRKNVSWLRWIALQFLPQVTDVDPQQWLLLPAPDPILRTAIGCVIIFPAFETSNTANDIQSG